MIEETLSELRRRGVVSRIWRGDHAVWKPEPAEIVDRLGWLTISDRIRDRVGGLEEFAAELNDEGYRHVVLLGMGGSSLGPEVIGQTFGSPCVDVCRRNRLERELAQRRAKLGQRASSVDE